MSTVNSVLFAKLGLADRYAPSCDLAQEGIHTCIIPLSIGLSTRESSRTLIAVSTSPISIYDCIVSYIATVYPPRCACQRYTSASFIGNMHIPLA